MNKIKKNIKKEYKTIQHQKIWISTNDRNLFYFQVLLQGSQLNHQSHIYLGISSFLKDILLLYHN